MPTRSGVSPRSASTTTIASSANRWPSTCPGSDSRSTAGSSPSTRSRAHARRSPSSSAASRRWGMSERPLDEKVAIVTGAGGGLGRAFALALAGAGAKVVAADRDVAAAAATAQQLGAQGAQAMAVEVDVADEASVESMATSAAGRWGRIDVLVNNAGLYGGIARKPFFEIAPAEWDALMAVNLKRSEEHTSEL